MKNSKGFINTASLNLILIFISLYFILSFSIHLVSVKNFVRKTCLLESLASQKKVLRLERKLVLLNPVSTALRTNIKITQAALVVATINAQFSLVAILQKKLLTLYKQQQQLDLLQKALLSQINFLLAYETQSIINKINHHIGVESSYWKPIIQAQSHFTKNRQSEIAFTPDTEGGLGPNYVLKKQAEALQSLSFIWHYSFRTMDRFQDIVFWTNQLKLNCSAIPQFGDKQWSVKISQGKF